MKNKPTLLSYKGFPYIELSHTPTPLEHLKNLSTALQGPNIWVKRDDCTGLAMGGNKSRQLAFYIGEALDKGADTILTSGAIQSNQVRMAIAAARKAGLDIEVQLEQRVEGRQKEYYESGNPLLIHLMGATVHYLPAGEDEKAADIALFQRAEYLKTKGKKPYVIPLSGEALPIGSLGYIKCAEELLQQSASHNTPINAIVLASGSATTHSGLLTGLRALKSDIPVYGFCVRRDKQSQLTRVQNKTQKLMEMLAAPDVVQNTDIWLDDHMLRPGYGQINSDVVEAIRLCAFHEGLLLDPTYTGKSMAGLLSLIKKNYFLPTDNVVFLHTGGAPGIFGYPELVNEVQATYKNTVE